MKTFLKIDFWLQLSVFFITTVTLYLFNHFGSDHLIYFYFIVGGFQLVSFIIKVYINYKKSLLFHFYGLLIVPIWFFWAGVYLEFPLAALLLYMAILGSLYAPIFSVIYIYDCFKTYKNYEKSTF